MFADSLVQETIRLSSGVFMVRYVTEDTNFVTEGGQKFLIRQGDRVAIYPPALHKDPEIFEDPLVSIYDQCFFSAVVEKYPFIQLLQFYYGEQPFDLMHELMKWKFLTNLSGVRARFHVLYELNRHDEVDSYVLKYGHVKCSRSAIDNYYEDYIANRQ